MASESRMETALLLIIILAGAAVRLYGIDSPFMGLHSFNEAHYSLIALNFFKYGLLAQMDELGRDFSTTPLLPWMIFASFSVLGVSELAARIPVVICGVLSLPVFYFLVRELSGRRVALLATAFAAFAPLIVYFSRNVQLESPATLFFLLALLLMARRSWKAAFVLFAVCVAFKTSMLLGFPALLLLAAERKALDFRKMRNAAWLAVPFILPALWYAYGIAAGGGGNVGWYFGRSGGGAVAIAAAIAMALGNLPTELGAPVLLLAVIGVQRTIFEKKGRRLAAFLLLWALAWYVLAFAYPLLYLGNLYYDYPGAYAFCIFAALALSELWDFARQLAGARNATAAIATTVIAISLLGIIACVALGATKWPFSEEPFQSAKLVREMNTAHAPVLVDLPRAMFYLGGDPAYIDWESEEGGIAGEGGETAL